MSNASQENSGSTDNIVESFGVIHGGEVSLRNGKPFTENVGPILTAQRRGNQTESNKTPSVLPKAAISPFDSPAKTRQLYNKTQTVDESRVNQQKALNIH